MSWVQDMLFQFIQQGMGGLLPPEFEKVMVIWKKGSTSPWLHRHHSLTATSSRGHWLKDSLYFTQMKQLNFL